MRETIYSEDFIIKMINIIYKKKIKFIGSWRSSKYSIPSILKYRGDNNGFKYFSINTVYDSTFREDSPRAAQFVHAYLTGKETYISTIEGLKIPDDGLKIKCLNLSLSIKLKKLLNI